LTSAYGRVQVWPWTARASIDVRDGEGLGVDPQDLRPAVAEGHLVALLEVSLRPDLDALLGGAPVALGDVEVQRLLRPRLQFQQPLAVLALGGLAVAARGALAFEPPVEVPDLRLVPLDPPQQRDLRGALQRPPDALGPLGQALGLLTGPFRGSATFGAARRASRPE
jgi:hypothetical protein